MKRKRRSWPGRSWRRSSLRIDSNRAPGTWSTWSGVVFLSAVWQPTLPLVERLDSYYFSLQERTVPVHGCCGKKARCNIMTIKDLRHFSRLRCRSGVYDCNATQGCEQFQGNRRFHCAPSISERHFSKIRIPSLVSLRDKCPKSLRWSSTIGLSIWASVWSPFAVMAT